jgi:glycosyltransferase involved in cell wall biosynthesis
MKIAIDVSPLQSGHKVRGVGFYLEYLKRSLVKYFPEHEYIFFNSASELEGNIDIVHYPYFDPFFLTLPLTKKYKTVVTVHDLTPLVFKDHFPSGIKGNLRWQMQRFNLKNTNAIITDSVASKNDIIKIAGISEKKVFVAYLAAADEFHKLHDHKLQEKVIQKYSLPEKFILYVGDATWNKNLPNLLKAIKELNITLVMVGKTLKQTDFDKLNPWNKDLVEINNLAQENNKIIRLGFIPTEDVVALYNTAVVFVMPSIYEGFGLPVIEAMQCGSPVVTTKGGSLAEVAGEAAYFVDGNDIASLTNGIGEVFFTLKLQQELSKKGLIQAKKFSWKKTAEETISVYNQVLENK